MIYRWNDNSLDIIINKFDEKSYFGSIIIFCNEFTTLKQYKISFTSSIYLYFGFDTINNIEYIVYPDSFQEAKKECERLFIILSKLYKMKVFL